MKNLTSKDIHGEAREERHGMKRFLAGSLVAAALLSSPLLEQRAYAQSPQPEVQTQGQPDTARRNVRYDVNGSSSVSLANSAGGEVTAYPVIDGSSLPAISFDGPATISARFYPIIRPADIQGGNLSLTVRYAVDSGTPSEESFTTGTSTVSNQTLSSRGLAIGTPKDISVTVSGEGRHQFSVSYPNGFLEIVSVLAPAQQPAQPVRQPPVQQPPVQQPPVQAQPPAQDATAGVQLDSVRSRLSLNYSGLWLHGIGNAQNGGSVHSLDILYRHPLGEHLALIVGPHLTFYNPSIESAGTTTRLYSFDATAMAGLAANFGDHTIYLAGFGGLQLLSYGIDAADGRSGSGTPLGAAYGGRIGYDYHDILGIQAQLSNNPFNPGTASVHFAIPYTWITGNPVRPSIDASLMWLHLMAPGTEGVGGASLKEDNLLLRAIATVPIWRLGPIVPSVLAGFEYDRSLNGAGPAERADALLGGGVTLDIADRFRLTAGAGASVPTGAPFLLVNANLLR